MPQIALIKNISITQPPQHTPPSPRHYLLATLGYRFLRMTILKVHWPKSKYMRLGRNLLKEADVRTVHPLHDSLRGLLTGTM